MIDKTPLTEAKETLFITLYAKALDNRSKRSILQDKTAEDLLKMIGYDLTRYKGFGDQVMVVRAKQFDDWVKSYIETNRNAVVLYLGCGLDTRISRINPPSSVSWFDVDYPEVIDIRKNFYADKDGYQMIASSVTEPDWIMQVPSERPTLVIAEGLLEYLTVDEVKALLNRLTDYFPRGQIMFDVMNAFAINSGKKKLKETTGAVHRWAVDDVQEVDHLNHKLKRVSALPVFRSPYILKLSLGLRTMLGILSLMPKFKNMVRLLKYEF